MGKKLMILAEDFAGPFNWIESYGSGQRTFEGRFLVYDRAGRLCDYVRGRIAVRDSRAAEVYLFDPPHYLGRHRHHRCMQLLAPNSKWFKLHFEKPARTFGDAYTFVEHLLTEAYNLAH